MPQYRKLHTKITESFDVNDMPDDFHRLLWTWLPLALCKEGRGYYHGGWIKSKVMPLREDISADDIMRIMEYFAKIGIIVKYDMNGREYFYIPTWHEYQNTSRDADSPYPEPYQPGDYSRPTQELVKSKSTLEKTREDKTREESSPFANLQEHIEQTTGLLPNGEAAVKAIDELVKIHATPDDITEGFKWLVDNGKKVRYYSQLVGPTKTAISKRKANGVIPVRKFSEVHE